MSLIITDYESRLLVTDLYLNWEVHIVCVVDEQYYFFKEKRVE